LSNNDQPDKVNIPDGDSSLNSARNAEQKPGKDDTWNNLLSRDNRDIAINHHDSQGQRETGSTVSFDPLLGSKDMESFAKTGNLKLSASSQISKDTAGRAYLSSRFKDLDLSAANLPKVQRNIEPDAPLEKSKEFTLMSQAEKEAASFFPIGLKEPFRLRKSDFNTDSAEEKRLDKFKPRIDELLDALAIINTDRLSAAERKSLTDTREKLQNCDNLNDALSNALHLARLYQHLQYIEEAKKSTLFALGIDPDNLLGKQLFKELERVHPVDLGISQVVSGIALFTKSGLRSRIINLSGGKVIVVGDLLIDELVEGRPERISREAPVLILEHVDTELIPGGAANTAHNITALGGKCHAIGVCGKDEYGPKLASVLEHHGITHSLVEDPSRPTTVKSRVISKSHSLLQQLLRIDRISHTKVSPEIEKQLIARIEEANEAFHCIIVSDYKAGVITDGVIAAVRNLAENRKTMVIVDAQNSFERFSHCTLMTPNQPDAEAASGVKITSRDTLRQAGEVLLNKSGVQALLITRGSEGMALFERGKPMIELPAFNRSEVFDVTGAGDTVVATMALALTSGASMAEAMALGNLAASIVVRKPGTEVTSQKEMLDHLEALNLPE
jgi:rfaE bifunctional protein kinase chain/domain